MRIFDAWGCWRNDVSKSSLGVAHLAHAQLKLLVCCDGKPSCRCSRSVRLKPHMRHFVPWRLRNYVACEVRLAFDCKQSHVRIYDAWGWQANETSFFFKAGCASKKKEAKKKFYGFDSLRSLSLTTLRQPIEVYAFALRAHLGAAFAIAHLQMLDALCARLSGSQMFTCICARIYDARRCAVGKTSFSLPKTAAARYRLCALCGYGIAGRVCVIVRVYGSHQDYLGIVPVYACETLFGTIFWNMWSWSWFRRMSLFWGVGVFPTWFPICFSWFAV